MHHSRRLGVLFAVALLVLGLAVPAAAKKGGIPGPPSGSDLDVTMNVGGFAWANSAGDVIPFEISVTNKGSDDLVIDSVWFGGEEVFVSSGTPANGVLAKNDSWTTTHDYTVDDLEGLPFQQSSDITKTVTVTATLVGDTVTLVESDTATMTAHPIGSCRMSGDGPFSVGPGSEYTVCSDAFSGADYWMLETTRNKGRGKQQAPLLTVRDGVPGNWCMKIDNNQQTGFYSDEQTGWATTDGGVQFVYFPSNGTCLGGGAGGETITTRNSTLFYMAYKASKVEATPCPDGVSLDDDNRLVCIP